MPRGTDIAVIALLWLVAMAGFSGAWAQMATDAEVVTRLDGERVIQVSVCRGRTASFTLPEGAFIEGGGRLSTDPDAIVTARLDQSNPDRPAELYIPASSARAAIYTLRLSDDLSVEVTLIDCETQQRSNREAEQRPDSQAMNEGATAARDEATEPELRIVQLDPYTNQLRAIPGAVIHYGSGDMRGHERDRGGFVSGRYTDDVDGPIIVDVTVCAGKDASVQIPYGFFLHHPLILQEGDADPVSVMGDGEEGYLTVRADEGPAARTEIPLVAEKADGARDPISRIRLFVTVVVCEDDRDL
mgnify:CR=1 FL=1